MNRDNQELFTRAWNHILDQGQACISLEGAGAGTCAYKFGRLGCAFAPAIKTYDPRMEGNTASELLSTWEANLHPWARRVDPQLAVQIQFAHDDQTDISPEGFLEGFKNDMRKIAKEYSLVVMGEEHDN